MSSYKKKLLKRKDIEEVVYYDGVDFNKKIRGDRRFRVDKKRKYFSNDLIEFDLMINSEEYEMKLIGTKKQIYKYNDDFRVGLE